MVFKNLDGNLASSCFAGCYFTPGGLVIESGFSELHGGPSEGLLEPQEDNPERWPRIAPLN